MVRIGLIGLGKMGISHFAIANAHPKAQVTAICDSSSYVVDVLGKYTGVRGFTDYRAMIDQAGLDAVIIASPSKFHAAMVRHALEAGLHVFAEKPFCLDADEGFTLAELAKSKHLVNQVGYHCRFVASFQRAKALVDSGVIGEVHHISSETYGPVVLRPTGSTWRVSKSEGGGCLYDYASHAINLATFIGGMPDSVAGTVLGKVFSADVEDEVYTTFHYADGRTGQVRANWSDDSYRKMFNRITVWGKNGKVIADRQECQLYLRKRVEGFEDLPEGWTIQYTTELTGPVWYYLRGEEYSAQMDHFISQVETRGGGNISSFVSAVETDQIIEMLRRDAEAPRTYAPSRGEVAAVTEVRARHGWLARLFGRVRGWFSSHG